MMSNSGKLNDINQLLDEMQLQIGSGVRQDTNLRLVRQRLDSIMLELDVLVQKVGLELSDNQVNIKDSIAYQTPEAIYERIQELYNFDYSGTAPEEIDTLKEKNLRKSLDLTSILIESGGVGNIPETKKGDLLAWRAVLVRAHWRWR